MKATLSTEPTGSAMHAMDVAELQSHIRTLITIDEDEAPLVSCYVPIGRHGAKPNPFEGRVREIRKLLTDPERALFDEPFDRILDYLAREPVHRAYHHGELGIICREAGFPIDKKHAFGIWEWGTR